MGLILHLPTMVMVTVTDIMVMDMVTTILTVVLNQVLTHLGQSPRVDNIIIPPIIITIIMLNILLLL